MKNPSLRVHQIAQHEILRQQAVDERDPEKFATAIAAIKELETQPDLYTCACCGDDFENGKHLDFLVASVLQFNAEGVVETRLDYGLADARRFKFCSGCVAEWKIPPTKYAELR